MPCKCCLLIPVEEILVCKLQWYTTEFVPYILCACGGALPSVTVSMGVVSLTVCIEDIASLTVCLGVHSCIHNHGAITFCLNYDFYSHLQYYVILDQCQTNRWYFQGILRHISGIEDAHVDGLVVLMCVLHKKNSEQCNITNIFLECLQLIVSSNARDTQNLDSLNTILSCNYTRHLTSKLNTVIISVLFKPKELFMVWEL